MSEACFVMFHKSMTVLEVLLYGACMGAFFSWFREGPGDTRGRLRTGGTVLLIYGGQFFLFVAPEGMGWLHMVFTAALLETRAGKLGVERKLVLLLSVVFFSVRSLSMMIMRSVDFYSERYFLQGAGTAEKVFLGAARNYIFISVVQFLLSAVMLLGVGKQLRKKVPMLHIRELLFLLWTPAAGILFVRVLLRLLVVEKGGVAFWLYEEFPAFLGIVPLMALSFYGGILAVIAACQRMLVLEEEHRKACAGEQQVRAMRERLKEAGELYDSMRSLRHEMRNHMANLKGIMMYGSHEDLGNYLARMDEDMGEHDFLISTGNLVTDVIINGRARAAAGAGVSFTSEFHFPSHGGYDPYDVGIILNNLLENALEACGEMEEDEGYVHLSGRKEKNFFLIQVKNSFCGKPVFDRDGLPVSTKKAGPESLAEHGIGLSNVRREAEKYLGDMDIKVGKGEFCVAVLLQAREEQ